MRKDFVLTKEKSDTQDQIRFDGELMERMNIVKR
jgi:hypothetical protein